MRIRLEIDSNKTSKEEEPVNYQQIDRNPNDSNWYYAFATFFLTIAIAIPQISSWVESQPLIKSLQDFVGSIDPTFSNNTDIAFPTVKNAPLTSGYGWRIHPVTGDRRFHTGIDFGAKEGTPIYATAPGKVEFAGVKGGYGNTVIVNHGNGKSTLYGHASRIYVKQGQTVKQGDAIAAVGNTGMSTGPHLHFEVRINGKPVNPNPYLAKR